MDEESRRIAELLAEASEADRRIFNACLTTGAHLRHLTETEPALSIIAVADGTITREFPQRRWYRVKLPPLIIGQLILLLAMLAFAPELTLRSAGAGFIASAAWQVGRFILKG